ncbi:ras-related GTP-binding protein, putative [Bodo saltans]|uniref:Ras-related GTP-binding protein, putative n=1 Tax=Bodo saltans TaxID=75058 RepID=A0A0S4JQT6_BODSA|nr:ras-related GTP-binding protein, putative [Bodo saltans]|eukprot:CUG93117.1 ras-related GTP-binding protein, putative [Bodo saltans]
MTKKPSKSKFLSQPTQPHRLILKILVVGAQYCGKTSLIRRCVHDVFNPTLKATLGVDFAAKQVERKGGSQTLHVWDVAGLELGSGMTRAYYHSANGAMVVCDADNLDESLRQAILWKADIDSKVLVGPNEERIPCILLVNKCDLKPLTKSHEELLDTTCRDHNFCGWLATSAKANINVVEAFEMITDHTLAFMIRVNGMIVTLAKRNSVTLDRLDQCPLQPRCPC